MPRIDESTLIDLLLAILICHSPDKSTPSMGQLPLLYCLLYRTYVCAGPSSVRAIAHVQQLSQLRAGVVLCLRIGGNIYPADPAQLPDHWGRPRGLRRRGLRWGRKSAFPRKAIRNPNSPGVWEPQAGSQKTLDDAPVQVGPLSRATSLAPVSSCPIAGYSGAVA